MKTILPVVVVVIALLAVVVAPQLSNSWETPNWGTEAFYNHVLSSDGNYEENAGEATFDNERVANISAIETENISAQAQNVLGIQAADGSEKWIEVDLSDKKLMAWEGNRKVYEFLVSTGRPGYETPAGEYRVWRKVRSQRYKGGKPGTSGYYNLPNVPYSLFWGGGKVPNYKGYAIHGAYWHNDFGIKNRSSGCVNMRNEEAGLIYHWAGPDMPEGVNALNSSPENPGIRVVVHD